MSSSIQEAVSRELRKFAHEMYDDYHCRTSKEAVARMYVLSPGFREDTFFNDVFPILFDIVLCEHAKNQ